MPLQKKKTILEGAKICICCILYYLSHHSIYTTSKQPIQD